MALAVYVVVGTIAAVVLGVGTVAVGYTSIKGY